LPDDWALTPDQKKKLKKQLQDWADAVMLGLAGAMVTALPGLIEEGDDWGGGGGGDDAFVAGMADMLKSQGEYADGFLEDISSRIDQVLAGDYDGQGDFVDAVMDMFQWAKSRAESYATGAGVPAWRNAAMSAMKRNGIKGGTWICTFGPGSCEDCQDLHGQWMTNEEFDAEWGNQSCNGGCNCGFMPSNDEEDLSDDDLEEVDSTVEDDDMEEAA